MLHPGDLWRHVTINTHCSWLPGDPKGFRSQDHKIHSSGDYKAPPPEGEHAGLHRYSQRISGNAVAVPMAVRQRIAEALRNKLQDLGRRVLTVAVGRQHTHMVVLVWEDPARTRRVIGQAKQKASHAVRDMLPGQVWAEGGGFDPILAPAHLRAAVGYDRDHVDEGAYVWLSDEAIAMLEGRLDPATLM